MSDNFDLHCKPSFMNEGECGRKKFDLTSSSRRIAKEQMSMGSSLLRSRSVSSACNAKLYESRLGKSDMKRRDRQAMFRTLQQEEEKERKVR